MDKRKYHFFTYGLILLLLTGCWDEVAIEERGFIVGSAIDLAGDEASNNPQVMLTNQFVVPSGIGSPSNGGGGSQQAYLNLSASGDSIFAIDEGMRTSANIMPFFEHLKVIVVSKDILDQPHLFPKIMDMFFRDYKIRMITKVMIAEEEAKEILDITPENEKIPALYIDTLLEKDLGITGTVRPVHIGDIHEHFLSDSSFTLPIFSPSENKIDYEVGAVFHGYEGKLVGTLNKQEMQGLDLIVGKYAGGPIEFEYEGNLMTFNITNSNSNIKIDTKDQDKMTISVNINAEGGIVEVFGTEDTMNQNVIDSIEKKVSEKIEEIAHMTIEKVQKDLSADVFGLRRKLMQRHYSTWQKVKDNWDHGDNFFSKSTFEVKSKVRVRAAGESGKSQDNRKE